MDTLATALIASIPNFAGFILLAVSNNRTISKLFKALQTSIDARSEDASRRTALLEGKIAVLEKLLPGLLELSPAYSPDLVQGDPIGEKLG